MTIPEQFGEEPFVIAHMLQFIYLNDYDDLAPIIPYEIASSPPPFMGPCVDKDTKLRHAFFLYLAGDKYGVHSLQFQAKAAIFTAMGMIREEHLPADILDHFLSNTVSNDTLRLELMRRHIKNNKLVSEAIEAIFVKHEPMAWKIGRETEERYEHAEERYEHATRKLRAVEAVATTLKTSTRAALKTAMSTP